MRVCSEELEMWRVWSGRLCKLSIYMWRLWKREQMVCKAEEAVETSSLRSIYVLINARFKCGIALRQPCKGGEGDR